MKDKIRAVLALPDTQPEPLVTKRDRRILTVAVILLTAGTFVMMGVYTAQSQTVTDPGSPGPCSVISQTVTVSSTVQTFIYYPSASQCSVGPSAPYPGITFAHGFSMFGFSDGAKENTGNGEHLASWGYVVAIPKLSDSAETRIAQTVAVLNYLETQASTPGSFSSTAAQSSRSACSPSASFSMLSLNLAICEIMPPVSGSAALAKRLKPIVAMPAPAAQKALRDTKPSVALIGKHLS